MKTLSVHSAEEATPKQLEGTATANYLEDCESSLPRGVGVLVATSIALLFWAGLAIGLVWGYLAWS